MTVHSGLWDELVIDEIAVNDLLSIYTKGPAGIMEVQQDLCISAVHNLILIDVFEFPGPGKLFDTPH